MQKCSRASSPTSEQPLLLRVRNFPDLDRTAANSEFSLRILRILITVVDVLWGLGNTYRMLVGDRVHLSISVYGTRTRVLVPT